jgi:hypothetical protein
MKSANPESSVPQPAVTRLVLNEMNGRCPHSLHSGALSGLLLVSKISRHPIDHGTSAFIVIRTNKVVPSPLSDDFEVDDLKRFLCVEVEERIIELRATFEQVHFLQHLLFGVQRNIIYLGYATSFVSYANVPRKWQWQISIGVHLVVIVHTTPGVSSVVYPNHGCFCPTSRRGSLVVSAQFHETLPVRGGCPPEGLRSLLNGIGRRKGGRRGSGLAVCDRRSELAKRLRRRWHESYGWSLRVRFIT